jgi:site-specific recombinase XerD
MNEIIAYPSAGQLVPVQARDDEQLIALWLHGRPASTQAVYRAAALRLLAFCAKPIRMMTLGDLQAFVDSIEGKPNTRKRIIASVKSLFTFGHKLGYLVVNVGAVVKLPPAKDERAARILSEDEVLRMIHKTDKPRDNVLLRLLYASAGRISEICRLTWADVRPSGDSGQVTLFGKGGKTRAVKLSKATWAALVAYRQGARNDQHVFISQKGGRLGEVQVHRIVKAAAVRAGIVGNVSAHWLRHSHASHALDRGASVVLVRDTLGHSSLETTSRYAHAKPNESSALHLAI